MTMRKHTESLDEILADYGSASPKFDPSVLQYFIEKYPAYAMALQRYAYVQLTSTPASQAEIDNVTISDDEMLHQQSKLLERIQKLRGTSSNSNITATEAMEKISQISGNAAVRSAAMVVFGECTHGEDLLLLSVTESRSDITGVPHWFFSCLGEYIGIDPDAFMSGLALRRQTSLATQRFSSKKKPVHAEILSWEQIVNSCITDTKVKKSILERS